MKAQLSVKREMSNAKAGLKIVWGVVLMLMLNSGSSHRRLLCNNCRPALVDALASRPVTANQLEASIRAYGAQHMMRMRSHQTIDKYIGVSVSDNKIFRSMQF
jgi:hypothetical protein